MTNDTNAGKVRETSAQQRWWACAVGLLVFLVAISICSYLVVLLLHIGPVEPVVVDFTKPLQPNKADPGFNALAGIAWAASGFLSASLAGLVARKIAADTSSDTFRANLIAGLVILVGAAWGLSLAAYGFDLMVTLRAVLVLVGGIFGIRKAA